MALMDDLLADEALLEKMVRAVEKVRDRLRRAAAALEKAGVPYAVAGGNARPSPSRRHDRSGTD
jgi:hypothetical protein